MYATAHRVSSPQGNTGINVFLHQHGAAYAWPADPSSLPEEDPGEPVWDNGPPVKPGGNRVCSSLDLLAPDHVGSDEIDAALNGLWLQLLADGAGEPSNSESLPNPLAYRQGAVVLRFSVDPSSPSQGRAGELAELRQALEGATSVWFSEPRPR